jgi:hypothetical protein
MYIDGINLVRIVALMLKIDKTLRNKYNLDKNVFLAVLPFSRIRKELALYKGFPLFEMNEKQVRCHVLKYGETSLF